MLVLLLRPQGLFGEARRQEGVTMYGALSLRSLAGSLVAAGAGFVLPLLLPEYFLYLGNTLMMYAVLALGLDLLLGWSGQFAFAHIAFFGIGIYATRAAQMRLGIPFVVGMPLAAALAGLIGLLIALSGDAAAHRLSGARDLRLRRRRAMGVQHLGHA